MNETGLKSSTISLINSFANDAMEMKQMGDVSVKLSLPPLLVMEGVNWAKFDSTKTGITRRLLPIDLSNSKTDYYKAKQGKKVLKSPKVLQWFAKKVLLTFSELSKGADNFMFNLDDVETMPSFFQKWHML